MSWVQDPVPPEDQRGIPEEAEAEENCEAGMSLKDYLYYQDDWATIYHGDCRDILPLLEPVDLVLTDPPYALNFPYLSYIDTEENLKELITVFPKFTKLSKLIAVMCGITPMFYWPKPDWIMSCCWDTTGSYGMFGFTQWFPVLLYGIDISGIGKVNGILKSDVIKVTGGAGVGFMREKSDSQHPCPKPLNLLKLLIARLSFEQQSILDPFCGIGTTLLAAKNLNRKAIGIEICEEYCAIAVKRLKQEVFDFRRAQ